MATPLTAARRRLIAPIAWVLLLVLSAAAALGTAAGPVAVRNVDGEPFDIGPLLEGWSVRQEIRPVPAPELFVGFQARPANAAGRPPTLEVRLERDSDLLWADRVLLEDPDMTEYVATFSVPTDDAGYALVVRVIEASDGGATLRGVNVGSETAVTQLAVMGQATPGFLALGHQVFQRVPPIHQAVSIASSLERQALAGAVGAGVLAVLASVPAVRSLARLHGRRVATVVTAVSAGTLAVWLLIAAAHVGAPSSAGVRIGVLQGLVPTGVVAVLAFPVLAFLGWAVALAQLPDKAAGAWRDARTLGRAMIAVVRRWHLAPIPLAGAAATVLVLDAEQLATALAVAAIGVALSPMILGGALHLSRSARHGAGQAIRAVVLRVPGPDHRR